MAEQYYNDPSSPYHGQPVSGTAETGYVIQGYAFDGGYRGEHHTGKGATIPLSSTKPSGNNDYGSGYSSPTPVTQPAPMAQQGATAPAGYVWVNGVAYDPKYAPAGATSTPPQAAPQQTQPQPQSSGFTGNVQPTQQQPQQTQQSSQPIDYTFHVGQETIEQYNQRIAAARGGGTGTTPGTQSNIQTGQQSAPTSAGGSLAMPANGSVVDLLNMAGQDSSFAARQVLAQQYGIQGYKGTAAQNTELGNKYVAAFNATKGSVAPDSAALARAATSSAIQGATQGDGDPMASFFDSFGSMDPITASLFQQIATMDSDMVNRQSYMEIFNQEMANSGVQPLKEDLAQVVADIRLTEDQVREELASGGGLVLESQVRGIAAARTKILMTKAEQLSSIISAKEEAVDRMVQLTGMDRQEADAQMDRKLGLTKMLFDMQTQMQDRARENYKDIVKDIGYDGLVDSISSQQELQTVARALGMSPSTLLQLSKVKTSAQRAQELDMMNFELSVDKFEEDKRQFGLSYALEQQKLSAANAASKISPYSQERASRTLDSVSDIRPDVSKNTVGFASLKAIIPGTEARNFQAKLVNLKSSIAQGELNEMREASKTGGALGQVAVQEIEMLQSSLGALDQAQSVDQFNKSLDKVEMNIYRWNSQKMSTAYGFDYNGAKQQGYSDQEIYEYLKNQ